MEHETAVGQLPEIIYLEGMLYSLYTTPLAPWLNNQSPPVVFDRRTSTCERGYVGKWSVENDALSLIGLYAWRDGRYTSVRKLFDDRNQVLADWYTGPLIIQPTTESVREGEYPKSKTLFVEAGHITQSSSINA
ncbi:MAG: hypothetical protein AAF557_10080 [Pseudomonadota bacterium]